MNFEVFKSRTPHEKRFYVLCNDRLARWSLLQVKLTLKSGQIVDFYDPMAPDWIDADSQAAFMDCCNHWREKMQTPGRVCNECGFTTYFKECGNCIQWAKYSFGTYSYWRHMPIITIEQTIINLRTQTKESQVRIAKETIDLKRDLQRRFGRYSTKRIKALEARHLSNTLPTSWAEYTREAAYSRGGHVIKIIRKNRSKA